MTANNDIHDSGQPLTQELLNSIMRNPGENRVTAAPVLPKCPRCEERYCGDGVQLCTECAAAIADLAVRWNVPFEEHKHDRQMGTRVCVLVQCSDGSNV